MFSLCSVKLCSSCPPSKKETSSFYDRYKNQKWNPSYFPFYDAENSPIWKSLYMISIHTITKTLNILWDFYLSNIMIWKTNCSMQKNISIIIRNRRTESQIYGWWKAVVEGESFLDGKPNVWKLLLLSIFPHTKNILFVYIFVSLVNLNNCFMSFPFSIYSFCLFNRIFTRRLITT